MARPQARPAASTARSSPTGKDSTGLVRRVVTCVPRLRLHDSIVKPAYRANRTTGPQGCQGLARSPTQRASRLIDPAHLGGAALRLRTCAQRTTRRDGRQRQPSIPALPSKRQHARVEQQNGSHL